MEFDRVRSIIFSDATPDAPRREVREQPDGSLYVTVGRLSQHLKGKEEAGAFGMDKTKEKTLGKWMDRPFKA